MTATLTVSDPDKLGLLLQCRQKMDQLNSTQLHQYVDSVVHFLSIPLLKKLLFVGLNSIKDQTDYNLLLKMHSVIKEIIETEEKAKKLKHKTKSKPKPNTNTSMFIVPKNASLTKTIPFDIISNTICRFLKMSSITRLAECDRKLAIICHTPSSITNLMHRYDPYQYNPRETAIMIDGFYKNMYQWNASNLHRFRNVERLSIAFGILDDVDIFNSFKKVKHLSFYDAELDIDNFACNEVALMPLLQSISLTNTNSYTLLNFLGIYKTDKTESNAYFNPIMYQLKSISLIDCDVESLRHYNDEDVPLYNNLLYFILPSQPNNLQVLKFENTMIHKTDHTECKEANDYFEDIDSIKASLSDLKGIVYGERIVDHDDNDDENMCLNLCRNILSNLVSFKTLESIHIHSLKDDLLSIYLNNNNLNTLDNTIELCVSLSMKTASTSPLYSVYRRIPKLEKLCVVINIRNDDDMGDITKFAEFIQCILLQQIKLKIFQIVVVFDDMDDDPTFCQNKIGRLTQIITKIVNSLNYIRNCYDSDFRGKQALLFKFHVKTCHYYHEFSKSPSCSMMQSSDITGSFAIIVQNMIMNYLVSYPFGKIQFKFSFDVDDHYCISSRLRYYMKGLNRVYIVNLGKEGSVKHYDDSYPAKCYDDMDFQQFTVSVMNKNLCILSDESVDVDHSEKWRVHCRYCCNTPWV